MVDLHKGEPLDIFNNSLVIPGFGFCWLGEPDVVGTFSSGLTPSEKGKGRIDYIGDYSLNRYVDAVVLSSLKARTDLLRSIANVKQK